MFFLICAAPALAQGTAISFGSSEHDGNLPVEVTSEELDVDQSTGIAVFTGDVLVIQGEMRLFAERVTVEYTPQSTDDSGGINRVLANGEVTIVRGPEAAEGDDAVYTLATGMVVMTGDVMVTQGPNVVLGDRLSVNLDDGAGVVEGNVKTIFQPAGASE
ncbi:MAG: LptA/OstA family protein [Pseudomonadota bacterium]